MKVKATYHGFGRIKGRVRARRKVYEKATSHALYKAAEFLLERTKEITPIETGDLRASGHVTTEEKDDVIDAYVRFNTPYAIYVHEDLTKYHAPPTTAKFLTISSIMWRKSMERIVATESEKGL